MYYLLDFQDHTFATYNTTEEVLNRLDRLEAEGYDLTCYEVINCFDEDSHTDGQTFKEKEGDM